MKAFLISSFCCCFAFFVHAANITASQNGNWNANTTWDLGRSPADNDVVIIPSSIQVDFNGAPYPKNSPSVRPTLNIRIYGILDFSNAGNDKLYLGAGSTIQIFTLGKIQTSSSSTEIIAIYNGSTDNTVWTGSPATLNGPASATATSSGFSNSLLPIRLQSFTAKKYNKHQAKLSWISASETNSAHFEIQYYNLAKTSWEEVGRITASANTSTQREYSFIVTLLTGQNQFRLKLVDLDGQYTYSSIVQVESSNTYQKAYYDNSSKQLIIQTPGILTSYLSIYDAAGKLILSQQVTGSIPFSPHLPGIFIVKIKNQNNTYSQKIAVR